MLSRHNAVGLVIKYRFHIDLGFLIHDRTIFADVDERQKAHALLGGSDRLWLPGYACVVISDGSVICAATGV